MDWIKFDYDDGAEVYYKINARDEVVIFKTRLTDGSEKFNSLFFDELQEVYEKVKEIKSN